MGRTCGTRRPRRTGPGRSLPPGHRRIQRDSSASGPSSTRPVEGQISYRDDGYINPTVRDGSEDVPPVRGSRPTLWLMLDSRCPPRDNGIPPCLHMRGRLGLLWTWTLAPSSGGQRSQARPGASSRTCPSPCCSCSPEGSSARGRHSTPPRGQRENRPVPFKSR